MFVANINDTANIKKTEKEINIMTENFKLKNLYKVSSVIAFTLGIMFIIPAIGFIISIIWPDLNSGWYSLFQTNWLIVIFKLHSGLINIQDNPLHGLNILDLILLSLFSIMSFGLNNALRKVNKIWPLIAFALSVITIILFIATQVAGRSTVMLSVMIFSFVMLRDKTFSKVTVFTGIIAGVFLFVGDLTVGINSNIITILFGIGYVLFTIWFLMIAQKLLLCGNYKKDKECDYSLSETEIKIN